MNRLCSPNLWVAVASTLGAIGTFLATIGMIADVPQLRKIGLVLIAPVVLGGIGFVLVVIPLLIIANRVHKQGSPKD